MPINDEDLYQARTMFVELIKDATENSKKCLDCCGKNHFAGRSGGLVQGLDILDQLIVKNSRKFK